MTVSFDGEKLFDSGPCRLHVGGRQLRHTLATPIGGDGDALRSDGRTGRVITQTGRLAADSLAALKARGDVIEDKLDGLPVTLIDQEGNAHQNVVMVRFEPSAARRIGPRWVVDYRIEYVQVTP
ncbi:MAG: hypothetical protein IT445_12755 [Phycisphaeraceae bacterium]|nr:hypothetical protein [Phycisphaeraceae bacterium]